MSRPSIYPDGTRNSALLAVKSGERPHVVAARMSINPKTLAGWMCEDGVKSNDYIRGASIDLPPATNGEIVHALYQAVCEPEPPGLIQPFQRVAPHARKVTMWGTLDFRTRMASIRASQVSCGVA